ncbi:ADP-heptose--LPS heptosyltransferase 2 [Commensalibacter sp. Nvir]|uniref:glycosyltransferase family 9 protein n=1 Tax=Commensalibacter sp. Nvir TaxID=3069817 RepID=UPI002D23E134|nr:ADP-heptose--LPS heptosyltransferase 2 [Commensalibacter sp. Nvir]
MKSSKTKNILFITSTRLGDAVISTGLLNYLLKKYPYASFTIACGPVAAGLFEAMPQKEKILIVEKKRFDFHWLILWSKLVWKVWDLIVDLRGSGLSFFLYAKQKKIIKGGRIKEYRVDYLAKLFNIVPTPLPSVWYGEKDYKLASQTLPNNHFYIALAPTANWIGKIWPIDNFIQLAILLKEKYLDVRFVILYGPGPQEQAMAKPLLNANLPVIDAGGRYTLPQVSALLSRCAGFIGNDSGLMHLASACSIPVLGLFGPSKISEYAPAGRFSRSIVAKGKEGAGKMSDLSVYDVYNEFISLIEQTR